MSQTTANKLFRNGFSEKNLLREIKLSENGLSQDEIAENYCGKRYLPYVFSGLENKKQIYQINDRYYYSYPRFTCEAKNVSQLWVFFNDVVKSRFFYYENETITLKLKSPFLAEIDTIENINKFTERKFQSIKKGYIESILKELLEQQRLIRSWSDQKLNLNLAITEDSLAIELNNQPITITLDQIRSKKNFRKLLLIAQITASTLNKFIHIWQKTEKIIGRKIQEGNVMATKIQKPVLKQKTLIEKAPGQFDRTPDSMTMEELMILIGMVSEFLELTKLPEMLKTNDIPTLMTQIPKVIYKNEKAKRKFFEIIEFICDNTTIDEFAASAFFDLQKHALNVLMELNILPFFNGLTTTFSNLIKE